MRNIQTTMLFSSAQYTKEAKNYILKIENITINKKKIMPGARG